MENFETIFEKYAQILVNWAVRKYKSVEDAEDLCQEAMLKLYKEVIHKEELGVEIEYIEKYLWKIAFSVLRAHRQDAIKRAKLLSASKIDLEIERRILAEDDSLAENETEQTLLEIRKSVAQLDPHHKEVVIMYYFQTMSIKEISETLNLSEKYVKKLLYESRQKLRIDIGKKRPHNIIISQEP